jgi:hypothetical protein
MFVHRLSLPTVRWPALWWPIGRTFDAHVPPTRRSNPGSGRSRIAAGSYPLQCRKPRKEYDPITESILSEGRKHEGKIKARVPVPGICAP